MKSSQSFLESCLFPCCNYHSFNYISLPLCVPSMHLFAGLSLCLTNLFISYLVFPCIHALALSVFTSLNFFFLYSLLFLVPFACLKSLHSLLLCLYLASLSSLFSKHLPDSLHLDAFSNTSICYLL